MKVENELAPARAQLEKLARPLGFVPTMGALHAGHLRLVEAARGTCKSVAVSLFVNPMQFGPQEDFERYPRDLESDSEKLAQAGADLLFAPEKDAIYPPDFTTFVDVGKLGTRFEGAARPTHFRGVATVVAKLLNVVRPDVLFLGQKDAQQTAVLTKLVEDLNFTTRVEIVETVREPDGLALSSRNAYLSGEERTAAPTLYAALQTMLKEIKAGKSVEEAREAAAGVLSPRARLEYLNLVDARTFSRLQTLRAPAFLIGAARFGRTRLLDNLWIRQ
jgi:pantoate--beta-alanine ligase